MKAELQFFAMPENNEAALAFIKDKVDSIETLKKQDQAQPTYHLTIGDCVLIYTASIIQGNMLIAGSIAINTGSIDNSCKDQERAKAAYRKLRNWYKRNYSNKLCTYNLEGDRNDSIARNQWISPAAITWKQEDASRQLKLYNTSPIAFDIMVVSKKIGKLVPVESKKIRGHGYAKK